MGLSSKRARKAKESDRYAEDLSDSENDQMTVSKILFSFLSLIGFDWCYNAVVLLVD